MDLTREEPTGAVRSSGRQRRPEAGEGSRKRAAIELVSRHEQVLRQTAQRYSLCADDAEDAFQRTLEIILTKAPTERIRELIAWAQTVTKHEALAIRRERERLLGAPVAAEGREVDWIALIPTGDDGPDERAERREAIARSREALQALKPAELRALTLRGEGYSYAEIGALTGFSRTKINRCLAEGRERFRSLMSRSEDGSRCRELQPLLSAFCDGEAGASEVAALREHLRACAACRATLRAYRAAPGAAAALAPSLTLWVSLLSHVREAFSALRGRLPGGGGATGSTAAPVAAGSGAPGLGLAALAKTAAVCVAAGGGAVAAGIVPLPAGLAPDRAAVPAIERTSNQSPGERRAGAAADRGPAARSRKAPGARRHRPAGTPGQAKSPQPRLAASPTETGSAEYALPPATPAPPPPSSEPATGSEGSAAGEFGP